MKYCLLALAVVGMALIATACGGKTASGIEIQDAWVRAAQAHSLMAEEGTDQADMHGSGDMESTGGSNTSAYLVIQNNSSQPDRLLSAYTDLAHSTELHISQESNGVISMRPVDGVDVPAGGKAEFKPGSYHIMLVGISRDLTPGEKIDLTLEFQNAGKIEVQPEVRAP